MSPRYIRLKNFASDDEISDTVWSTRKSTTKFAGVATILLLVVASFATVLHFSSTKHKIEPIPQDYGKMHLARDFSQVADIVRIAIQDSISLETTWNRFWWNTEYSPKNHNESDELWDAILPSHGFIAMDADWAFKQQWPDSMRLPNDSSKRVYLLEVYHQLHCLVSNVTTLCVWWTLLTIFSASFRKHFGRRLRENLSRGTHRYTWPIVLIHCDRWVELSPHFEMSSWRHQTDLQRLYSATLIAHRYTHLEISR